MDYSGYAEHNKVRSENKSELILCVTRSVTGRASHIFNVLYAVVYTAVHTLSAKTVQCTLYSQSKAAIVLKNKKKIKIFGR